MNKRLNKPRVCWSVKIRRYDRYGRYEVVLIRHFQATGFREEGVIYQTPPKKANINNRHKEEAFKAADRLVSILNRNELEKEQYFDFDIVKFLKKFKKEHSSCKEDLVHTLDNMFLSDAEYEAVEDWLRKGGIGVWGLNFSCENRFDVESMFLDFLILQAMDEQDSNNVAS